MSPSSSKHPDFTAHLLRVSIPESFKAALSCYNRIEYQKTVHETTDLVNPYIVTAAIILGSNSQLTN